jgi:hypothetical protein
MLNYKEIDIFFGSPLNYIPRPHRPYQFKLVHLVGVAIVGYVIYKGAIKIKEDVFGDHRGYTTPLALKEKNKE